MVKIIKARQAVGSIYLSNGLATKVIVLNLNGKFLLENFELNSEQNAFVDDLLQKLKPGTLVVLPWEANSFCFAVPGLNSCNLEIEKQKRGITDDTQCSDYISVSGNSLLASISHEAIVELSNYILNAYPRLSRVVISHPLVALLYLYLRSYHPQSDIQTAILFFSGLTASLLVMQGEMPVWTGSIDLRPADQEANYSEICAFLQAANEQLDGSTFQLLLLAGDCDAEDAKAMRKFAQHVELFSPFRNSAFEFGLLPFHKRKDAEMHCHRLAVPLGGAGMMLEDIGINLLSESGVKMDHELPLERQIPNEQTALNFATSGARMAAEKAIPFLTRQRRLFIASILIALTIFSYRFTTTSREAAHIEAESVKEQKRTEQLADVRNRYEEYKRKIGVIQAHTSAINEIRKKQLTVKTVLDEMDQRIPTGLVFSELEVQETNLRVKGYAPDRFAINTFANRLGQSMGIFADVVPLYDDKTNAGNYEISCRFVGPIPPNSLIAMQDLAQPELTKVKE